MKRLIVIPVLLLILLAGSPVLSEQIRYEGKSLNELLAVRYKCLQAHQRDKDELGLIPCSLFRMCVAAHGYVRYTNGRIVVPPNLVIRCNKDK